MARGEDVGPANSSIVETLESRLLLSTVNAAESRVAIAPWSRSSTLMAPSGDSGNGSNTITTVASFDGTTSGAPLAPVSLDQSGNLYGTTAGGGTYGYGTVFEIAAGTNAITTLASFDLYDGVQPLSGVTLDGGGNLYGATPSGGANNDGTIFEIAKGSNTITALASFNEADGGFPEGSLILDSSGNVYGTTANGGSGGYGTVFEMARGSNSITTLASFNDINGDMPKAGVILDGSGNLYGTAFAGGANDDGTIFEIASGSNAITDLASFGISTGTVPLAGLALDNSGNFYGTAWEGGAADDGTVFELPKGSNTITALASFDGFDGTQPQDGLLLDSSGNLYGTAYEGGAYGDGTVFEIASGSNAITTLATFDGSNGAQSQAGLTLDGNGDLYGTTQSGGASRAGTVFELPAIVLVAPAVNTDPTSQSVSSGNIVTFNAAASGNPAPAVQWQISTDHGATFTNIAGATSTTFSFTAMSSENGDEYRAVFSNSRGSATTTPATLKIATAVATTTTLTANGANPSNATQSLSFIASVSGGVPDGETVMMEDASNNDHVIAIGTLSSGSAALNVPAGSLLAGTHNLIAVYGGDGNFAASQSAPYAQMVQVVVTSAHVNGNLPSLIGVQRSMVDSIVYSFSEAVNLSAAAASIAVHSGQSGIAPTLTWTALNPNSDGSATQWAASFSGPGVVGNSIANGVYDISLNTADVTSDANPTINIQPRPTDTFYRLFGDINGDGVVNAADNLQLKTALSVYNAAFDYNDDGLVNAADNFQFKNSMSLNFASSSIVYTI